MMQYKGYIGKAEFDVEDEVFRGCIVNIDEMVTFSVSCWTRTLPGCTA